MDDWEIKRREELDKEIPDGCYNIGKGTRMTCLTGKGGYINFQIEIERQFRKFNDNNEFKLLFGK